MIAYVWSRYAVSWGNATHALYGRVVRSQVSFDAFELYREPDAAELVEGADEATNALQRHVRAALRVL